MKRFLTVLSIILILTYSNHLNIMAAAEKKEGNLQTKLCAAPVTTFSIVSWRWELRVPNSVICPQADPLGKGTVLTSLDGKNPLGFEGLVRGLQISESLCHWRRRKEGVQQKCGRLFHCGGTQGTTTLSRGVTTALFARYTWRPDWDQSRYVHHTWLKI